MTRDRLVRHAPKFNSIINGLKSIRIVALVIATSIVIMFLFSAYSETDFCAFLSGLIGQTNSHLLTLYILLFIWSFLLFLTVIPLGTVTIVAAGFVLGPAAGFIQFLALVFSSLVLFEFAGNTDGPRLVQWLENHPRSSKAIRRIQLRGVSFCVVTRIIPVIPSAIASLGASYVGVSRRQFLIGTVLAGWIRPVFFGFLGALGRMTPVCSGVI